MQKCKIWKIKHLKVNYNIHILTCKKMVRKAFNIQQHQTSNDEIEWVVLPNTKAHEHNKKLSLSHRRNKIKTTKYTLLSFLPKNIFEQFHRFANIYFLFIVILNWIPAINAFGKEINMLPLIFVLAVTAIKDLVEDRQRYNSDKVVNNRMACVYDR